MDDIKHVCGTCRRWKQIEYKNWPESLSKSSYGTCNLNGKETKPTDKDNCFGWKAADIFDLVIRQRDGLIEGDFE